MAYEKIKKYGAIGAGAAFGMVLLSSTLAGYLPSVLGYTLWETTVAQMVSAGIGGAVGDMVQERFI